MFQKPIRLYHTLKYLRPRQLFYQGYYRIKNKLPGGEFKQPSPEPENLVWESPIIARPGWLGSNTFEFLNLTKEFKKIDWNFSGYGKLWTYNLTYFEFLNQQNITVEEGLHLIWDFIQKEGTLIDALEPYPISLRGINWIKFLSRYGIKEQEINNCLFCHYQRLYDNVEYHLMGNHLLENGFSLLFAGVYFKDGNFLRRASKILRVELREQILKDGAHFELSPMYHQIILHRLLDCIHLLDRNFSGIPELRNLLQSKAVAMLGWLETVTFSNGNIPMVNDSAFGIAPKSRELFQYAADLGLIWEAVSLKESGYRKWANDWFECFFDMGNVGPDYIPGHAHADTFSFELYIKGQPYIVELGTSTYEKNAKRREERGTRSHNTVMVNNTDQSEVWGGFRVARRAKIIVLDERNATYTAAHDGYKRMGVIHQRTFQFKETEIYIEEILTGKAANGIAYFHFHPAVNDIILLDDGVQAKGSGAIINFIGGDITLEKGFYEYAKGFNKTEEALVIQVSFTGKLTTTFTIK